MRTNNILTYNHAEAFDFFMKSEQYHGFELPEDMDEKRAIIDLVYHKLCNQPNSSYNQLWLQNMTYTQDKKQGTSPYTLRLCQLVAGKTVDPLWNNDWLKAELTTNIPYDSVVYEDTLKKVTPVITFRETRRYTELYICTKYDERTKNSYGTNHKRYDYGRQHNKRETR